MEPAHLGPALSLIAQARARLDYGAAHEGHTRALLICEHQGEMHLWRAKSYAHTQTSFYVPDAPDGTVFVRGTLVTATGHHELCAVILTGMLSQVPEDATPGTLSALEELAPRINAGEADPRLLGLLYHLMNWNPRPELREPARALSQGRSLDEVLSTQALW